MIPSSGTSPPPSPLYLDAVNERDPLVLPAGVWLEVESVQVLYRAEGEDTGEGQQQVEEQDEQVVC